MYKNKVKNARKILTRKNCTFDEAIKLTSATSAWRLFSCKVDKLIINYNKKAEYVNYNNIQFDIKDAYRIAGYVVSRYLDTRHFYFDDIVSEAVKNFLLRSGSCEGKVSELSQTAFYTMLDFKKRKLFKEHVLNNEKRDDNDY